MAVFIMFVCLQLSVYWFFSPWVYPSIFFCLSVFLTFALSVIILARVSDLLWVFFYVFWVFQCPSMFFNPFACLLGACLSVGSLFVYLSLYYHPFNVFYCLSVYLFVFFVFVNHIIYACLSLPCLWVIQPVFMSICLSICLFALCEYHSSIYYISKYVCIYV